MIGLCGVQACKHLGLYFLETRQRLAGRAEIVGQLLFQGDGVAHLGSLQLLDACNDVTHLARLQRFARQVGRCKDAQVIGVVSGIGRHHLETLALGQAPIHDTHQHHHTHVGVEPAVNDHRSQRRIGIALGRRHLGHDQLQDVINAHAGLG